MSRVLVAMSGGVDSSVAAAILGEEGHEVVGVTLRLWGGDSDSGCCSVSDVDDARRVAQQLDIDHFVFNLSDDFDAKVVEPYVADHALGRTPNPCIECNRHLKFDRLLRRAEQLGFDALATGHHARIVRSRHGRPMLSRALDHAKDQSYVLHMLTEAQLDRCRFPVGEMTKAEVRAKATELGLRTAGKPDSQDVCFIAASLGGRQSFLRPRLPLHEGVVVDGEGTEVGRVDAVELITLGQRKGLGLPGGAPARYAVSVDVAQARVVVGSKDDLLCREQAIVDLTWRDGAPPGDRRPVLAQCSAHGVARPATLRTPSGPGANGVAVLRWDVREARVAPGQSIVFYDGDTVLGGGKAANGHEPRA